MRLAVALLAIFVVYNLLPEGIRWLYGQQGLGDQHLTFWLVVSSFVTPLLWPVFQLKVLVTNVVLPIAGLDWLEGDVTYAVGRLVLTPRHNFSMANVGPAPDFSNETFWSMMPNRSGDSPRQDAGDVPVGMVQNATSVKSCSAFYL